MLIVLAYLTKIIHLIVCIALIVIVLFQADKGEGLAGAFGGGASATIFGERGGETQISKMTTILAVVFMVTSLVIAVWGPGWEKEIRDSQYSVQNNPNTQQTAPIIPGATPLPGFPMGTPMPMGTSMPMGSTETPAPVMTTTPVVETAPVQTTTPAVETTPAPAQTTAPVVETTPAPAQTAAPVVETTPAPAQTAAPVVETTPAPIQTPVPVVETTPAATIQSEPNSTPMVVPATTFPEDKPKAAAEPVNTIPGVNER